MRSLALLSVPLLLAASALAEDWTLPRGNLANTGVVKNAGPKREPKIAWKRDEGAPILTGAALADGLLVYAVGDTKVVCRGAGSGASSWEKAVKQAVVAWPAIAGELVFFGGQDQVHYRVNMKNASEPHSEEAKAGIVAPPAVTEEHYLAGSLDGRFYAMSSTDGKLLWSVETGPVRHAAALEGKVVYVASEKGVVYALSLARGAEAWRADLGKEPLAAPIVDADRLLLPCREEIVLLDLRRGERLGALATPGLVGAPAVERGLIHYGTADGHVVSIDSKTGKEARRTKVAPEAVASPLVLARKILYGAAANLLFALDPASGKVLWTFQGTDSFQPPIVAGGALYAGAGSMFYCLK